MPKYPKLRDDLVSSRSTVNGQPVYTVKDPITQRYFRLREAEFWLIGQLDGESSPEDIARGFRARFDLAIGADELQQFVDRLEHLAFLESGRAEQLVSRAGGQAAAGRSLASRILYLKVKAFDPGKLLDWLTALYRPFHKPIWFVVQGVLIMIGLSVAWTNATAFRVDVDTFFTASSLPVVVFAFFVLIVLHESAHAVMCRYYGGEVKEVGFLFMYFMPCFYCDVSDAWLFERKRHRLAVTWAGPHFQLVLLCLAVILWRLTVPGTDVNEIARAVVIVSWLSYLFNFNPLIKLDGYYLLSDWLEIPNLRQKSFAYLGNVLKRRVLGWPVEPARISWREKRIFLLYAVLALLYTAFLLGYMLLLVGRFLVARMGGFGLLLLFAVLTYIFRRPLAVLARGTARHIVYMKQILKKPARYVSYAAVFVAVFVAALAVPFPHRVSGEVVVRPMSLFTLSLNEFGLLESSLRQGGQQPENKSSFLQMTANDVTVLELVPLVRDGQEVGRGDTIALLTSSQINREIAAGQAELERLREELNLLNAPPKKEEIAEAAAEVNAAKTNHDQLLRDYERTKQLVERNLETPEKLEAARAAVDIARAELSQKTSGLELLQAPPRPEEEAVLVHQVQKQQAQLDYLKQQFEAQHIIAPIGGTIQTRAQDNHILKISNNRAVELLVPVSDFDITLVEIGQPVVVKVRSYPARTFSGTVVRIPKSGDDEHGKASFPVSVAVDNLDGLLREGMSGYAKVRVGEKSLVGLGVRKVTSLLRVEFWSWW